MKPRKKKLNSTDMSVWAQTIFQDKYAHENKRGRKETWPEMAGRVVRHVFGAVKADKELVRKAAHYIIERKFVPGGRYLYAAGLPYHQTQNCYQGDTLVVTRQGVRPISSLSGGTHVIMTTKGEWVEAPFYSFGKQSLMKVVLTKNRVKKELYATPEHSWRIAEIKERDSGNRAKTDVLTKDLKPGDQLWQVFGHGISRISPSPDGVRHGVVFGDGCRPRDNFGFNCSNLRLCGDKNKQLLKFFAEYPQRPIEQDIEVSGLPGHYKEIVPVGFDRTYLFGWLAGYFAADGCVDERGGAVLSSTNRKNLERVREVCYILGIGTNPIFQQDRISNLTGAESTLYGVSFIRSTLVPEFFLIDEHRKRFETNPPKNNPSRWTVESVQTTDRIEEVYCAVVPETHEFVLEDNILTGNCFLFRAEDSREGWAELLQKVTLSLMTGGGVGVDYSDLREEGAPIRKTRGVSSGPIALMQMINEAGRYLRQGGNRRSAIWAGLSWKHPDILKFIRLKDWIQEVRGLKERDFNFPASMDGTNISVLLDDEFFEAVGNKKHVLSANAYAVYWETVERMLKTAEPGFSVDVGKNTGETLRNAPVSGNTYVLLKDGYARVGDIVGEQVEVWTGKQWAPTTFRKTKEHTPVAKVTITGGKEIVCDPEHEFLVERWHGAGERRRLEGVERVAAQNLKEADVLHYSPAVSQGEESWSNDEWYTLGYIYGDGTFHRRYPRAEVTLCTEESKRCLDGFASHLFTRVNYSDGRGFTRAYTHNHRIFERRSKEVFPEDVYSAFPECRASFVAGLFDADGNWFEGQNALRLASKHKDFLVGVRRLLESLKIRSIISTGGVSTYGQCQGWLLRIVTEDVEAFRQTIPTRRVTPNSGVESYRPHQIKVVTVEDGGVEDVFCCDVGVEEHAFQAEGIIISNCTEITSADDSDVCNLGSVNLSRIDSLEEMKDVVEIGTAFLLAGTVYSMVPYPRIDTVRTKNRRLGLGVMGVHEWLLMRGKKYGPDDELAQYMEIYAGNDKDAAKYAKQWKLSVPKKCRAIAPNGTIGIVAETTTGIEPIFRVAYKRRYLDAKTWRYQYVIDPTAKRLIESKGLKPEAIEDAYLLAEDVERRVAFQAWMQQYVDHGISSTINLPSWGSEQNNKEKVRLFGEMLLRHLPKLRGVTVYPDEARGGQPLVPVKYETAIKQIGEVFEEAANVCSITKGGSCGE